jgi:hypothetical protein
MTSTYSPEESLRRLGEDGATLAAQIQNLGVIASLHLNKIAAGHGGRLNSNGGGVASI